MGCHYYNNGLCRATGLAANETARDSACLTYRYVDCMHYQQASTSGCLIASAVCDALGKTDRCYELTVVRGFIDAWLGRQKGGMDAIIRFHTSEPRIVSRIEHQQGAGAIWKDVYTRYMMPCIGRIEAGDNEGALKLYSSMVGDLAAQYA